MKSAILPLAVFALILNGCLSPDEAASYKERIYIPPVNTIACLYDSAQVQEGREEYYSAAVAKKMEGCLYPHPEPKRWESYQIGLRRLDFFSWGLIGEGWDSANRATQFFRPGNSDGPFDSLWVLRATYKSTGGGPDTSIMTDQWHYRKVDAPYEYSWRNNSSVQYDRSRGGFVISGPGYGTEIFILE